VATYGPCQSWDALMVCDVSCESPSVTADAVAFATEVVWALSGRQFGLCEVTLRPCRQDCATYPWPNSGLSGQWSEWPGHGWLSVALVGGQWFNVVCGRCTHGCSCTAVSEVRLPAPVHRIVEVRVDGDVLPTGSYRLDDARTLVRTDGGEWPRCNDLNLEDTEDGTWSVTAEYGREVPDSGRWAVGELACQLIRARNGEDCLLPANVTQLVRQGVTIQFPNVVDLLRENMTSLYLVNLFIATYNPHRLARRSGVYSVDRVPARRTGT
jgi:hypothetical protein